MRKKNVKLKLTNIILQIHYFFKIFYSLFYKIIYLNIYVGFHDIISGTLTSAFFVLHNYLTQTFACVLQAIALNDPVMSKPGSVEDFYNF